ncbi:hypothetical protein BH23ACT9_BH23ACT9_24520 [soil metagenome]
MAEQRITPSDVAVRRLQQHLGHEIDSFTEALDADISDVQRAVASDREDLAVQVLQAHIAKLEDFQDQLRRLVAGAVVEREAEGVIDALGSDVAAVPAPPPPELLPPPPPPAAPPAGVGGGIRRSLLAAACIVAVTVLVSSGWTPVRQDPLVAAISASEQALAAVEGAATGSSLSLAELVVRSTDLHTAIAGLDAATMADPAVRLRIESMLADQQQALASLSVQLPVAGMMLEDLRELARTLDLNLPFLDAPGLPALLDPVPSAPAVPDPVTAGRPSVVARPTPADAAPQPQAPQPRPSSQPQAQPESAPASPSPSPAAEPRPAEQPPRADPRPAPEDGATSHPGLGDLFNSSYLQHDSGL